MSHCYTREGFDRALAWHEVGHFLNARDCGLAVTCMTIDQEIARHESGPNAGGFCTIPDLDRAPIDVQVQVLIAGIVGSRLAGYPYRDGAVGGDFTKIFALLDGAGIRLADECNAIQARAERRAEQIIRTHWDEAQNLVERLIRERTIRFVSPAATRSAVPWSERRAELDAEHGAAAVDQWLRDQGFFYLVTPATPLVQVRREMLPLMTRSATVRAAGGDEYEVVFSTGAAVTRTDAYGERYSEELVMTSAAVDLSRLNARAPLLASHDASNLNSIIGVVSEARLENGIGLARIRLSQRPEVAGIVQDVRDGVLHHVSVGYKIVSAERVDRTGDIPTLRVTRWQPMELSLVAIPADPSACIKDSARKFEASIAA
jgi:HK97 family phage prohead protease